MKAILEVLVHRIRELRKELGVSQAKLAVTAGMDPATLNRIEQGKANPNLRTLEKLADALGVSVSDLLESGAPKPEAPASGAVVTVGSERSTSWDVEALPILEDVRDGKTSPEEAATKLRKLKLIGSTA